ncbi:MAG TPA: hypothetical protein VHN11_01755 [Xanthobacteraceae bacterium]|nr:hypothetical protein [Xanthobacteraceae bacterium]
MSARVIGRNDGQRRIYAAKTFGQSAFDGNAHAFHWRNTGD